MKYLRLIKTVLLHKWYVFVAGWRLKVPFWRLVVHDLSKFSRAEFRHYARHFYGDKDDPEGFASAWLHHQNRNLHHWEYWVSRSAGIQEPAGPLVMPWPAVREMVADWFAAGKAYNGAWPDPDDFTWYEQNRERMQLDSETAWRIAVVLTYAARWKWR